MPRPFDKVASNLENHSVGISEPIMQSTAFDVAIVGGGAAGLATAIFTARANPRLSIAILDGARKLGAKILVSGGGRCNVTNVAVSERDFGGGSKNVIRRVLRRLPVDHTIAFFGELGVELHEEEGGKLFPNTNSAHTVLDALLVESRRLGIRILTGHRVTHLRRDEEGFLLAARVDPGPTSTGTSALGMTASNVGRLEMPMVFRTRRAVLAAGGMSLPKTGSDGSGFAIAQSLGHSIITPVPALAPLILDGAFHEPLSGITHEAELSLYVSGPAGVGSSTLAGGKSREYPARQVAARFCGSLLWTHFGISGPTALDVSGYWHRARAVGQSVRLLANLLPGLDPVWADQRLVQTSQKQPRMQVHNAVAQLVQERSTWAVAKSTALCSAGPIPGPLSSRVIQSAMVADGLDGATTLAQLSRDNRKAMWSALMNRELPVHDSRGFGFAEVTSGGVPLNEIDPTTLESRCCPGLFLVGEILDADGRIGGFNFQWAWSSAFAAAESLASCVQS